MLFLCDAKDSTTLNTFIYVPPKSFFVFVCLFVFSLLLQGNMYVFGGEFTATNETPLWTFNFRKFVVFSVWVEIILRLRSFSFLIQTLSDTDSFFLGSRVWRKQAAKSWVRLD